MPAGRSRILFVCMGNICRSPLAECVFRHKAAQRGVLERFSIDSAGTGGWHAGEPPDPRMRQAAEQRGVKLAGCARQVRRSDFSQQDLLVCMDRENQRNVLAAGAPRDKVRLLLEFDPDAPVKEVPDPYYGGAAGFDRVFDMVDSACDALLEHLLSEPVEP